MGTQKSLSFEHKNKYFNKCDSTHQVGFWVGAFLAENKSLDKSVKKTLKFAGIVGAIDNETVVFMVKLCLSTKFTTKVLGGICNGKKATVKSYI